MNQDLELFRLYQYMYRIGMPIISDWEYNKEAERLSQIYPDLDLNWENVSHDEGIYLMRKYNIVPDDSEVTYSSDLYVREIPTPQEVKDEYHAFKMDKNRSIPIINTNKMLENFYNLFKSAGAEDLHVSLKLDGWNISMYVVDGEIKYAHPRARIGDEEDKTSIIKAVLKDVDGKIGTKRAFFVGEAYLESKHLEYLRNKYGKKFKTTRNSVSSFLNNKVTAEDMSLLSIKFFKMEEEGRVFQTAEEMYNRIKECGLQTPINMKIPCTIKDIVGVMIAWGNEVNQLPPSDGIVYQPNDFKIKNSLPQLTGISPKYETGIYALKMGVWGEQIYKTVIRDITFTEGTKGLKPSLLVEPIQTRDGRTVTTVPVDHIGRLVDEDLHVGKEILIKIVSEKDIRLVYNTFLANIRTSY